MKTVFAVFTCDIWHTNASKWLIGICDNRDLCEGLIVHHINDNEDEPLSEDDKDLLWRIGQTQNYEGEGEFIIEEIILNTLI